MAEWSLLPSDLLELIARRLTTHFDVLRFRAICSSWRAAVSPRRHLLPCHFPILSNKGLFEHGSGFHLSKRIIYRIGLLKCPLRTSINGSSQVSSDGWLIKVEEDVPGMMHLLNPLTKSLVYPLPSMFSKVLDLSNLQISILGQEYVLQCINYHYTHFNLFVNRIYNLYVKKVAFFSSKSNISFSENNNDDFILLTILVSRKLAMYRSGEEKWSIIEDLKSDYVDVICFKAKFYAINGTGRTVIVEPSATMSLTVIVEPSATFPVICGSKIYLVESEGNLLLVYRCDDFSYYSSGWFKAFKLDEGKQEWVELQSLDGRLLFLGESCSFSASASDFPCSEGNHLFFNFTGDFGQAKEEGGNGFKSIQVFNLDNGCIGPLASNTSYSKLFWPPPSWVASPTPSDGSY